MRVEELSILSSPLALTRLDLYSMEVLTRAENGLEDIDADRVVWKWAKPNSPYRTRGRWCPTIDEAVEDGIWSAGKGLMLLAEKVSVGKKNAMFQNGRKPVSILSNEAFERERF
jgi:hypothetical protein